jgi:hypothetical protein
MKLRRDRQGDIWFEDLPPFCVDTCARIPEWLASADPAVQARLRPRAAADEEVEAEWRRYGAPELERLFLSREQILRRDLSTLARARLGGGLRFRIAHGHENAWLSALNGARHALFIRHGLAPEDIAQEIEAVADPERQEVLARIYVLGWLQELLLAATAT